MGYSSPVDTPAPPNSGGGRGQALLTDLLDPHRARGSAGLIGRAIEAGYLGAFCIDYAEVKKTARELLVSDKPRVRAAGVKLMATMANHDLKLMEIADKADRLDGGGLTERVGLKLYDTEAPTEAV